MYDQHHPHSNNQCMVVSNHNNGSTMHMCTGKTYKVNNNECMMVHGCNHPSEMPSYAYSYSKCAELPNQG